MKLITTQNGVAEFMLSAQATYTDPYNEVDVDAVFTYPDGSTRQVPAYWCGDNRWRIRFSADTPGAYSFSTVCSSPTDPGLHDQTGSVEVHPYTGTHPLRKHGRLQVGHSGRHFIQSDGAPFFWVGDTWWMGFTDRLAWPEEFQMLTADRVRKHFNVIQIVAGPLPDMDVGDPRGRNEAGFPFQPDFAGINPAWFDLADLKVAHLVDAGLIPCIVGMWGYYLLRIGIKDVQRFWRYLIARYGAYPVVWCLAGEAAMPYYLSDTPEEDAAKQRDGWTAVARYVRNTDPFHNLITIHPTQKGREMVADPSLLDFEMLQTGHGGYAVLPNHTAMVREAVAASPTMPVVPAEGTYEGIFGGSWQDVQRQSFHLSVLCGAAGHTYGANGIWQMNTADRPYGPSPHGRCWGHTPWKEAMHFNGATQVGLGGQFVHRFPWWELASHPEWIKESSDPANPGGLRCVGIPQRLRVIYIPLLWDPPTVCRFESGVAYRAYYHDPCTGTDHDLGAVTIADDGTWKPPFSPEVHDWILVLESLE